MRRKETGGTAVPENLPGLHEILQESKEKERTKTKQKHKQETTHQTNGIGFASPRRYPAPPDGRKPATAAKRQGINDRSRITATGYAFRKERNLFTRG